MVILCEKCVQPPKIPFIRGDGYCQKHGRFFFQHKNLFESCKSCAEELQICQRCGTSLKK